MIRYNLLLFATFVLLHSALGQNLDSMTKEQRDVYFAKIRAASEADHKAMMNSLGIESLRPGVNGNDPNAHNGVNYDEAKANPFPKLPEVLVMKNGKVVKDAKSWWSKRAPEIREDFDREVYGHVPAGTPSVRWEVTSTTHETKYDIPVVVKKLVGHVDNRAYPDIDVDIELTLTLPANAMSPVPVILELSFVFPLWFKVPPQIGMSGQQQILAKGWGYASMTPTSVQADNGAGLNKGIIGLMNKGQARKPDDWGALRAWAWGASRVMDYFESDPQVDAKRIGIEGHSRYGKATAVTMAYDSRFAIAYISSSGAGGTNLHRRNYGEVLENVAAPSEYHWMAGNYLKYAGPLTRNDLPVDSHELLALCAPRPVFIGVGDKGDEWVDARGMFMAAVAAGPVYKLLGKKDLGTTIFPALETSLTSGDIAYRQHSGGHTPQPNWEYFLEFAERFFER
jgi:hypothetical protein